VGLGWRWTKISTVPSQDLCLRVQGPSVLQAQNNELASDVLDGMCALGIESHRVAALSDALMSVGVDPNPMLTAVETEHMEAHVARMMEGEVENGMSMLSEVHMHDDVSSTPLEPTEGESAVLDSLMNLYSLHMTMLAILAAVLSPAQALTMQKMTLSSRFLLPSADTI
jgi:hypothetical protein